MMQKKIGRVAVLSGGPSSEREISLKSGKAVYDALSSLGIDVVYIDPVDASSVKDQIAKEKIDLAFIALHGRFGEDGTIQSILDEMGVAYTGSGPEASRLALDKELSKKIFLDNAVPTPRHIVLSRSVKAADIVVQSMLPVVIKPANEGSSIGLTIVERADDLAAALEEAFSYDQRIIIEEYIDGEDITVGILDERPLPVIHIKPKDRFYSYKAKYTKGMTEYIVPADIPKHISEEAKNLALRAHALLGCRSFSRVDMLIGRKDSALYVLEVNTIPGLTATSLLPKAAWAEGIDFTRLCLRMVESAMASVER